MSEILIVGGGVIGLLSALELVRSGASVTLVEMGETGRESSWAGGGIVSPLYPWRAAEPIADLAAWSQLAYPGLCAELEAETGIDPEYIESGLLILETEERDRALAWGARRGVEVQAVTGERLRRIEPELGSIPAEALLLPAVAQVRNPRLVKALRAALAGRIRLREGEEVAGLLVEGGRALGVRTAQGELRADRVLICTGAWTSGLLAQLGPMPQIEPVRGQMILFLTHPGQVVHITLSQDRYAIPRRDGRVLFGSTLEQVGFVKATTAEAKEALYRAAVEMYPLLKRSPIEDHWAGLRPGSRSGIPYIGPHPGVSGLYINAGHFRTGLGSGPASARLAADLLLGRPPILDPAPYALDAPHRSPPQARPGTGPSALEPRGPLP